MSAYNQPGPKCPNHKIALQNCKAGVGQCPESLCLFSYDEETMEITKKKVIKIINGEPREVEVPQEEIAQ